MTKERLMAFAKAWSSGDLNKVMQFFKEDCVYQPSVRNGNTIAFKGKLTVRRAIANMMEFDSSVSSKVENIHVHQDFGFWEWEYIKDNGTKILGCDVFSFQGDKIVSKNTLRKVDL